MDPPYHAGRSASMEKIPAAPRNIYGGACNYSPATAEVRMQVWLFDLRWTIQASFEARCGRLSHKNYHQHE